MNIQQQIIDSFKNLETEGKQILSKSGWDGKEYQSFPNEIDYFRFRTQSMNLVRRACGENSDHYKQLTQLATGKDSDNSFYFVHCYGVVVAARRDFELGLLFEIRSLITAEVLEDFLIQAEYLLKNGYYIPAASLAGAVLEDTLRKLGEKKGIAIPEKTKIDSLNSELARNDVYDKLIQKRITALADIRNNADHGHFDKFSKEDVEDMLKWIIRFTSDYLK
jgi:hypothetical protein